MRGSKKMLQAVELLNHQPHLQIKIQSKDDSDSVSDEEGQEGALAYQVLGAMHLGFPPQEEIKKGEMWGVEYENLT
jgi:hypothetical protein